MIWSGVAICLTLSGVVVAHHYAPLYAPDLVLAWSPSTDHITRAVFVRMAANPAGVDSAWLRDVTRRCSDEDLARVFRSGPPGATRAGMILGARIDQPGTQGASARAVVERLIAEERPEGVAALISNLPKGHPVTIALVESMIEHPHLFVALCAVQGLAPQRTSVPLSPAAIATLRRTLAGRVRDPNIELLTADPRPGSSALESYLEQALGYRVRPPLRRAMTAAEFGEWEGELRWAAWRVLIQHQPDLACHEARSRWDTLSEGERERFLGLLASSDERAVGFLVEHAAGSDALAPRAAQELASLCVVYTGTNERGCAEAFVALVDLIDRQPARRAWVEKQMPMRWMDRQTLDRIAARLPHAQRDLALGLLDAPLSATLRAAFDQSTLKE